MWVTDMVFKKRGEVTRTVTVDASPVAAAPAPATTSSPDDAAAEAGRTPVRSGGGVQP